MVVIGDDGLLLAFTANLDVLQPLGNDQLLFVGTVLYEDHFVIVHKGPAYLDGFVDGTELSRAVACHENCIRIVVAFCLCCDRKCYSD